MSNPDGGKFALAPAPARSKKAVEPKFEPLPKQPETLEELFYAVAKTVKTSIKQNDPTGKKPQKTQEYALPWPGFTSWRDARNRLQHFEKVVGDRVAWRPFNDSTSNDGPMSLNAYPGRAFIERVTNEGDAVLEAKALSATDPMPASPAEAAEKWCGISPGALADDNDDDTIMDLAKQTVTVTGWVGDAKDVKDSVFDARDYGVGLTGAEMPNTILSLNRGNKKSKRYLTGKHGQGASSTYQYADCTLIASRKVGSPTVAFTFVEGRWDADETGLAKTPTYRYLTIDGKVPEITVPEADFRHGTLVRHIGYNAADLSSPFGQNSLYGLLMRSVAEPLFPVWLEMYSLKATGPQEGYPAFIGYRRFGRTIRGTVNALQRAWAQTLKMSPTSVPATSENPPAAEDTTGSDPFTKVLHRASEYFQLPTWDFGSRLGEAELGRVKITYWVGDAGPKNKRPEDVLRNWVDPNKTILMTLDGQTHAEESRSFVTSKEGANLWAVGRYMVVQIDCNGLSAPAKYEMFTSTREHAKETPIKKMILEELVRRLSFDKRLEELNSRMAAADVKQPADGKTISELIKQYLKAVGISFETMIQKVEKWTDVEEEQPAKGTKHEPPPIAAVEPPTFIHWKFAGETLKMWPGQRHSAVFETDAAPQYWNPGDPANSKIKVLAHGIRYVGAGEMKGGRVRCHFECPTDLPVGTKGCFIQVQLEYAAGAAIQKTLPVEIIEKPKPKSKPPKPEGGETPDDKPLDDGTTSLDPKGEAARTIKVKIRKRDFSEVNIPVVKPQPVNHGDSLWGTLGWPADPHQVGFSIRQVKGKIHLYYNVEFPPFLDMKNKMSKKGLGDEFVQRYEMKLILHTIFTLNYDFVDEDDFPEEQRRRVRSLLCAAAESLALAAKSELELAAKLKSEDSVPSGSPVAAHLEAARAPEAHGSSGSEA